MSVLEISDLSIRFGGLQALQDVNITVNEWEIVGLIGPNGAGKTTCFNCITGFYRADTGKVIYRGTDVTNVPPHDKAAMGFGRTFQNVGMVKSATALENLKTAQHAKITYDVATGLLGAESVKREERRLAERADAILELLGLTEIRDLRVGGLSYGTLKLLELGCALATDPDILLLDEPTSGMGPDESDRLGERLLDMRKEFGLTMLLIEHHVPLVLAVCDHVYVLNFGRMLAQGIPTVIQTHPEVIAAYLGGEAAGALAESESEDDPVHEVIAPARAPRTRTSAAEAPTERTPLAAIKQAPAKAAAKKTAAKKAPAETTSAKKAAAKKAAAKKASVKKAAAKKAPVKKAPVKKAPVKKAPVKKAPVKKAAPTRKAAGQ